jgi:mRNA interferase MazF
MPSCSKNDIVLVRYPFTNLTGLKVRPAVVVSTPHASQDLFVVQ